MPEILKRDGPDDLKARCFMKPYKLSGPYAISPQFPISIRAGIAQLARRSEMLRKLKMQLVSKQR